MQFKWRNADLNVFLYWPDFSLTTLKWSPRSLVGCVLLFIRIILKHLTSLPPGRLSSKMNGLFFGTFSGYKHGFFILADTPRKVENIHRAMCFAYSCFHSVQF